MPGDERIAAAVVDSLRRRASEFASQLTEQLMRRIAEGEGGYVF